MAQSFNILPSGDVENDGWSVVAGSATTAWEVLASTNDSDHLRCPSYRGGVEVSFPVDDSTLPEGAVIDSVTVLCRVATSSGSGARGVTLNVLSSDNRSRYTTRTIWATSNIATSEVCTYSRDPMGRQWDVHRLNKLRLRCFSHNNWSDSCRVYRLYCRVNYHLRPTVSVTAPSGTITTPSPAITWTYTQAEGEPQKSAEYKIFTLLQSTSPTFNPDTATPVTSGTVEGIANSYTLTSALTANSYAVYVRSTSQYNAKSTWASKQFTLAAPAPGVPGDNNADSTGIPGVGVPTVVPDSYTSSAALRMTDSSNLLSVNQADFEVATDPLGYVGSNATLSRDTSKAFGDGNASMKILASSAADASATSTKVEVADGQPMTVRAQVRSAVTSRTITLTAQYYDETHTLLGSPITASGADSASTWTELVATGTPPTGARYCEVVVKVASPALNEAHNVDHVGLMYGTNTAWSDGGHVSRNLLTSFLATGDDPAAATDAWIAGNTSTALSRVTNASLSNPTGAHGEKCNRMTYSGVSPSISHRATSSTYSTTTTGTGFTLNKPSGVVNGDLLIAYVTSTEAGTITPPSGWTLVNSASTNDGSTDIALHVLKRDGLAADPSTWTTGTVSVASSRRTAVVVAYSGAASAADQFVADAVRTDTTGNVVHQTATVVNNDPNAWRAAAFAASDNVTGGSWTANITPPSTAADIAYVGKATAWIQQSNTSSFTLNRPSGVAANDVLIASVLFSGIVGTVTTPTGWTLIQKVTTAGSGGVGSGQLTSCTYYRVAGGSEPNSWSASHSDTSLPKISQVVAYRNVDTSAPILASSYATKANSSSVGTGTVTNTDSGARRVSIFGAITPSATYWASGDVSTRVNDTSSLQGYYDTSLSVSDSNGPVSTGSHSRTGSLYGWGSSFTTAFGWIGLLKPLASPPSPGVNETERADFRAGSSSPWDSLSVYDSAGVVATGTHSVYGSFTSSDGSADSVASWIGIIKPATPIVGGKVETHPNTMIDLSSVDTEVITLTGGKVTIMADFRGSASGTPTLSVEFYRANQLIGTQSASGRAFNSTSFTKSWAVFDVPTGTTRIRPTLSALDRAASDTVEFGRVAVMLGSAADPTQEPQWRNGTARQEHIAWSKPVLQYQENDGTGYGDWKMVAGQKALPPAYDLGTAQMFYVDHTIIPNFQRRYRVSTTSYGLNGDVFSSGYGPASLEVSFEPRAWWLKDIKDLSRNMRVIPRWRDYPFTTANMATAFQPIGSPYPVVVTEGFRGDTFSLELHCESTEFTALMELLNSGRTLILQSDIDKTWWVRPIGNIEASVLATGSRQERPRRYVTVNFVQVAPEE